MWHHPWAAKSHSTDRSLAARNKPPLSAPAAACVTLKWFPEATAKQSGKQCFTAGFLQAVLFGLSKSMACEVVSGVYTSCHAYDVWMPHFDMQQLPVECREKVIGKDTDLGIETASLGPRHQHQ